LIVAIPLVGRTFLSASGPRVRECIHSRRADLTPHQGDRGCILARAIGTVD
jgi:hypothetical protein